MYPLHFHSDNPGVHEPLLLYNMGSAPARCDLNCEISINQHNLHPKGSTSILLKQKAKKRNHADLAEQFMRCPRLFPLSTSTDTEVVAQATWLDKSDLLSFLAQKGHDQAIQPREKHPFLCSALEAQAWQNSLLPNELSLYD